MIAHKPVLLVRCDASRSIGAGHLMRSLAFGHALSKLGYQLVIAHRSETLALLELRTRASLQTFEAVNDSSSEIARLVGTLDRPPSTTVIDGYHLNVAVERNYSEISDRLIVFDDMPSRRHVCDVLVDPNPARLASEYSEFVDEHCLVLTGPQYAMVGTQWRKLRPILALKDKSLPIRVIVQMGATDPTNASVKIVRALLATKVDIDLTVVLGAAAPFSDRLQAESGGRYRVLIQPPDLPRIIAESDWVIGTPGSSSFERAVVGTPSILIPLADNQSGMAAALDRSGAALVLTRDDFADESRLSNTLAAAISDDALRQRLAAKNLSLSDGQGAVRVNCALVGTEEVHHGSRVCLRLAESGDREWLYDLQCRPGLRQYSHNPDPPTKSEHDAWYGRVLNDPDRYLLILKLRTDLEDPQVRSIGFVRLDDHDPGTRGMAISIAILPEFQGQGFAAAALRLARRFAPGRSLVAKVQDANVASIKTFTRCGYKKIGPETYISEVGT